MVEPTRVVFISVIIGFSVFGGTDRAMAQEGAGPDWGACDAEAAGEWIHAASEILRRNPF